MMKFKGFGARRGVAGSKGFVGSAVSKIASPAHCLPGLYSPRESSSRRRSVDGGELKADVVVSSADGSSSELLAASGDDDRRLVARRRSVDNSLFREMEDLRAVRREDVTLEASTPVRWRSSQSNAVVAISSSDSFSSASSRPSDASVVSDHVTMRHQLQLHGEGERGAVVVGFDANAREASVSAAVLWAFRNVLREGDLLVMVGVMEYIRGPLGYKVQVDDQTWLGASEKALHEEIRTRNAAWLALPGLQKLCEEAGVKLLVDVKAAARAEIAIVQEAVAVGAVHVVLDKSLHNRRRRYYLERLSCDVTRMRRSGGVDAIRSLASIASDREKVRNIPSPTSVLSTHRIIPQRPPRGITSTVTPISPSPRPVDRLLPGTHNSEPSFNASLSRLVKLVEEKNGVASPATLNPTIDETADDLFSIDMAHRISMLLEPLPDLTDHRRDQVFPMGDDNGYESDDLFSLAGDGVSRRPSTAVFCPPDHLQFSQSARNSFANPSLDFSQLNLDSGPRLDKRLLPS